jgi:scytalone dehydratase
MSPAVRKIPAEPNLDISFQGLSQSTLIHLLMLISTDYLILSKLVFDWADSYDAKVHFPSHSMPIRH